jgi:hypothetical protein
MITPISTSQETIIYTQITITRAAHQSGREAVHWSNGVLGQRMRVDKVLCTQGLVQ